MNIHEAQAKRLMEDIFCVELPKVHEMEITLYSTGGLIHVFAPCTVGREVQKIINREFEKRFTESPKVLFRKGVKTYDKWDKIRRNWLKEGNTT